MHANMHRGTSITTKAQPGRGCTSRATPSRWLQSCQTPATCWILYAVSQDSFTSDRRQPKL